MTVEEFQKEFGIIGKSKQMRDLADIIMQVAPSDITVLIYGESGVGKEVIASAIHRFSKRANKKMINVNCGAIPEGILESELFGHVKGSFTGATDSRKGYFELADKSTLFLDEIGEMPLTTQVKLLRAIETKEFMKLGSERVTNVDVRYIAATNRDLQEDVNAKKFRKDLYFRLKAVTLIIPPLRERKIDIDLFARHFLKQFEQNNRTASLSITERAIDFLQQYHWPGNVRELKNVIETTAALSKDGIIDRDDIVPLITIEQPQTQSRNLPTIVGKSPEEVERELIYRALFELKRDILGLKELMMEKFGEVQNIRTSEEDEEAISMQEAERKAIINALKHSRGNKRKAALILDISERTLYRKMKEYNIYDY